MIVCVLFFYSISLFDDMMQKMLLGTRSYVCLTWSRSPFDVTGMQTKMKTLAWKGLSQDHLFFTCVALEYFLFYFSFALACWLKKEEVKTEKGKKNNSNRMFIFGITMRRRRCVAMHIFFILCIFNCASRRLIYCIWWWWAGMNGKKVVAVLIQCFNKCFLYLWRLTLLLFLVIEMSVFPLDFLTDPAVWKLSHRQNNDKWTTSVNKSFSYLLINCHQRALEMCQRRTTIFRLSLHVAAWSSLTLTLFVFQIIHTAIFVKCTCRSQQHNTDFILISYRFVRPTTSQMID